MNGENLTNKFKHLVFKLVCPIYLWSIGMKSLEQYWDEVYEHEKFLRQELSTKNRKDTKG